MRIDYQHITRRTTLRQSHGKLMENKKWWELREKKNRKEKWILE